MGSTLYDKKVISDLIFVSLYSDSTHETCLMMQYLRRGSLIALLLI